MRYDVPGEHITQGFFQSGWQAALQEKRDVESGSQVCVVCSSHHTLFRCCTESLRASAHHYCLMSILKRAPAPPQQVSQYGVAMPSAKLTQAALYVYYNISARNPVEFQLSSGACLFGDAHKTGAGRHQLPWLQV
ncbi:hypothetical protein Vafri_9949 [Volvox africanus]|nr:hypothetical protein Vafri_9949 [Volvox africanus]